MILSLFRTILRPGLRRRSSHDVCLLRGPQNGGSRIFNRSLIFAKYLQLPVFFVFLLVPKKKCCARIPVGSSGIAREPRDGEVSHFVNLLSVVRGLDHYVILIWASIFHRDSELLLLPGTATGSSLYKSCTNVTLGMWNWRNPRGCADWWFWLVWAVVAQVYELICTNFEGARSVCVPNLVSDGVSFDELLSYLREISGRFIDLIGFQVLRERDGTGQIYDTL